MRVPDARPLFAMLESRLVGCLKTLSQEQWNAQTAASKWKVKDVAAHLLDGNLRSLSMLRDGFFGDPPPNLDGYDSLVAYLNGLNADWVNAMKRVSPAALLALLEHTGQEFCRLMESLDPATPSPFSVAWAGEEQSTMAFHIAREYTEKWIHQQQIREAAGATPLFERELIEPLFDTFFQAIPHHLKDHPTLVGFSMQIHFPENPDLAWRVERDSNAWSIEKGISNKVDASLSIPLPIAWKLFSKSIRPAQVIDQIEIQGDRAIAERLLEMVTVMA